MPIGLPKAEYAVAWFTEMGIGCRRDPLEANMWYVRAADQGDERAKHRIAAIRAAASGASPLHSAAAPSAPPSASVSPRKEKVNRKKSGGVEAEKEKEKVKEEEEKGKGKRWGIF